MGCLYSSFIKIEPEFKYGNNITDKPKQLILFHGSPIQIQDTLNPSLEHKVIYGASYKWIALCFASKLWTEQDIWIGFDDSTLPKMGFIIEIKKGSFEAYFKNVKGWLYTISSSSIDNFHGHPNLGLHGWEWITEKPTKILSTTEIPDIMQELIQEKEATNSFHIITYGHSKNFINIHKIPKGYSSTI